MSTVRANPDMTASSQRNRIRCPVHKDGFDAGTAFNGQDAHFRGVLENLPAAIYTTDAEGRITFFNEAAVKLWGRRPKLGEGWCGSWRLYWPDGSPMAHDECPMAIALRTGEAVLDREAILERPDGTRVPFRPCATLLHDQSGAMTGAANMLIDLTESKREEWTQQQLVAIVESSGDAIVSKDLNGVIISWNRGAEHLFGYSAKEIVGKSVTILIPDDHQDEEPKILARIRRGVRVDTYETVRQRKDGSLVDVSLTVSPVKDAGGTVIGASKIARDISERKEAERKLQTQRKRLATLNRIAKTISRDLDLETVVQSVTDTATELSGAKYGAFFHNVTDGDGESYRLYTLSGAPREAFEKFGLPRNTAIFEPTFRGTAILRSDDIRKDPRYGKNKPHNGMPKGHLPVASYLAVPVMARSGEVLGGLFFGHPEPGVFDKDCELLVKGIAAHAAIAIENARLHEAAQTEIEERRRAEGAKELLLGEIKHRVKNTFATVQAIAAQTFRSASGEDHDAFLARVQALAGAYDLLTDDKWERVPVREVVDRVLDPFHDRRKKRFLISGMEVWLDANTAVLLAMALHELATNAVKYGALSNANGRVRVEWSLVGDIGAQRLTFLWRETNGPAVSPPDRKGFGSKLIERALTGGDGKANFTFAPKGVECSLELALD